MFGAVTRHRSSVAGESSLHIPQDPGPRIIRKRRSANPHFGCELAPLASSTNRLSTRVDRDHPVATASRTGYTQDQIVVLLDRYEGHELTGLVRWLLRDEAGSRTTPDDGVEALEGSRTAGSATLEVSHIAAIEVDRLNGAWAEGGEDAAVRYCPAVNTPDVDSGDCELSTGHVSRICKGIETAADPLEADILDEIEAESEKAEEEDDWLEAETQVPSSRPHTDRHSALQLRRGSGSSRIRYTKMDARVERLAARKKDLIRGVSNGSLAIRLAERYIYDRLAALGQDKDDGDTSMDEKGDATVDTIALSMVEEGEEE